MRCVFPICNDLGMYVYMCMGSVANENSPKKNTRHTCHAVQFYDHSMLISYALPLWTLCIQTTLYAISQLWLIRCAAEILEFRSNFVRGFEMQIFESKVKKLIFDLFSNSKIFGIENQIRPIFGINWEMEKASILNEKLLFWLHFKKKGPKIDPKRSELRKNNKTHLVNYLVILSPYFQIVIRFQFASCVDVRVGVRRFICYSFVELYEVVRQSTVVRVH